MNDVKTNTPETSHKKRNIIIAICVILALLLGFGLWYHFNSAPSEPPVGITAIVDEEGQTETEYSVTEYIKFPGYNDMTYTKPTQTMHLYNPADNNVYFVFSAEDVSEGSVVWESEKIYPGDEYDWAIQEYFGKGNHVMNLTIKTYHLDSDAPMNGLNEVINFTIQ